VLVLLGLQSIQAANIQAARPSVKKGLVEIPILCEHFWIMATPRNIITRRGLGGEPGRQFFHCISRVVNREFVFEDAEREQFAKIMRMAEDFCGVRVLTWTILSNHFHILLDVPEKPKDFDLSEAEFWRRIEVLYSEEEVVEIRAVFRSLDAPEMGAAGLIMAKDYRQQFLDRMLDLSEFMKTLKQRFSMWFNREHKRVGTLWEARFKSVLVEGDSETLMKVAAYVDLNAVRAGMVSDPKDYRWCGYAEALGASKKVVREKAKGALRAVIGAGDDVIDLTAKGAKSAKDERKEWKVALAEYRKLLFGVGDETMGKKGGFSQAEVEAVLAAGGKLSVAQLLRCRVRHFSDGLVIGSRAFVNGWFEGARESFGERRKTGARKVRGSDAEGVYSMRDLRKGAIGDAG
jgi:REP element-mobilizing transposase RayT